MSARPSSEPDPAPVGGSGTRVTGRLRSCRAGLALHARRFRPADQGIVAVEFALILPTLLLLLLAGAQVITYVDATRKVDLVAQSISQMISRAAPPTGQTVAKVDAGDLHFSYDSTLVLFPYVMRDARRQGIAWYRDISVNYAGIQFKQKSSTCPSSADMSACYTANVVWTSTGASQPSEGANYRPCGTALTAVDDKAAPSRTTLPRSAYGAASLVVIDVVFTFKPTFASGILPSVRIARSAYVMPRYASFVDYDLTNSDGIATRCPGF
ncbi:TadE/TadG family type IV pilus assembly protein [Methylorubrum zatmanii]